MDIRKRAEEFAYYSLEADPSSPDRFRVLAAMFEDAMHEAIAAERNGIAPCVEEVVRERRERN